MKGTFHYVLLGLFGFFLIVGVFVFASLGRFGGGGGSEGEAEPRATVWGTVDATLITSVAKRVEDETGAKLEVEYRQFGEDEFERAVIDALARGTGPDVVLLPQDMLAVFEDLITPLPFASISARQFRDTFVEEAELYLTSEGALGLPVFVDPMVLYWNRTLFTNAGLARPPRFWDELLDFVPKLSKIDASRNVTQSAIALGEFANIENAKHIVSLLMLQAGTPVVIRNAESGALESALAGRFGLPEAPAASALRFYTEFSNPVKAAYSWNRGLPPAGQQFASGDLAMYLGFASEAPSIAAKNPNLNFDVASMPQVRDGGAERTFGRMHGMALLKASPRPQEAFAAMLVLSSPQAALAWSELSGLPPARRDVLAAPPGDAYQNLFYTAALQSSAFLDPDPGATAEIVRRMVESVTSGRSEITAAVEAADAELAELLKAASPARDIQ